MSDTINQPELVDAQETDKSERAAPVLSKSWAIKKAHVPTYTGGKITHCRTGGIVLEENAKPTPFLLLPVGGDVSMVDAQKGVKICSIRGDDADTNPLDDHEDDEGLDADAITVYALSSNDQLLLTCSRQNIIREYMIKISGAPDKVIVLKKSWGKAGHTLPVTEIEFHQSSVFVATGSVDGTVRIWDVRGGFVTHVFRPLAGGSGGGSGNLSITALRWLNDMKQLVIAIARDDGSIAIHDLRDKNMENVVTLRDHVSAVTSFDWNTKQDIFISTGRDAVINVWKVLQNDDSKKKRKSDPHGTSYERVHTLPVYEQVEAMVLLPPHEGREDLVVAIAGSKGQVRLWKLDIPQDSNRFALKYFAEQDISQSFGEARGGYMDMKLCLRGNGPSNDEKYCFAQEQLMVADAEHNVSFLSLLTAPDNLLKTDRTIVGHNDDILDLKIIPSITGKVSQIVVATNSAQVRIFKLEDFSCEVLDRHSATILCVDVSPCGRYISTCGKDKQMRIWHVESKKCVACATGHTEAIGSAALSRKITRYDVKGKAAANGGGSFAVTVSVDRTLKRWNLPGSAVLDDAALSNEEIALNAFISVRAHEKDINIVSVAPNDSMIATGSHDKTVKLWKATDLSLVATLKGHRRGVWDCQFSAFDRVLATCSGDKTIKIWSLSDYSCVRTFQGHISSVLRVRFLNGGLQLLSSGADGLLKLWTIRTNECAATMDGHDDKVWALDLEPKTQTMVSGGADSRINQWEDVTSKLEEQKQAEEEEVIIMEQRLANHMRHKEYDAALQIALAKDKPQHTLKILTAIIEDAICRGETGEQTLRAHVLHWDTDQLVRILRYCREWNTRARNCHVTLLLVKTIVSNVPIQKLLSIEDVPEILAGIIPYAERHFDRIDRLYANSFVLDFAIHSMGCLDDISGEEFQLWESTSKLVLPSNQIEGRIQVGGAQIVGAANKVDQDDDVITLGSDSSTNSDGESSPPETDNGSG